MGRELSEAEVLQVRNSFRRCSTETVEAVLEYRKAKNADLVAKIVYGIIARYTPAESSGKVSEANQHIRLIEDLGIDSLTMLEVVLSIEEALTIRIENEELMQIRTLGDVQKFIADKVQGVQTSSMAKRFSREDIIMTLPQQPPFLFLDSAEVEGDVVRASYQVKGDEYFLEGHFKGDPIFPASLVFEGMGQAACLWILVKAEEKLGKPLDSRHVLFGSMESAHFYRKAKPGEKLDFEISLNKLREPLAIFSGKASVGGEKLSSIEELVIIFGEATESITAKTSGAQSLDGAQSLIEQDQVSKEPVRSVEKRAANGASRRHVSATKA
ncbi:MAG: phosphopantetheine-binding protein [Verrucomicrobiota bacterium]